jgi:hypothetical protein
MFVGKRRCAVPMSAVIEQAGMAELKPPYERFAQPRTQQVVRVRAGKRRVGEGMRRVRA